MIEDRSSYEITRNERENSSNKLMSHFQNSNFLAQQEELSMFIKNMPIIRIEEVNSLNKLIELLIRQNQALGNKCQQNVLTVKEMFNKHEELIRVNHQLQKQLVEKKDYNQQSAISQQQIQSYYKIIEQHELKLEQTSRDLKNKQESVANLSQQTEQLVKQNGFLLEWLQQSSQLFRLIGQRNYKKCSEKIKELSSRPSQIANMTWNDLQSLQRFVKEEKKKVKYLPKVREIVESFCHRSLKVFQFGDSQTVKQQLKKQIQNLLNIIDDLLMYKKKNNLSSSQSRLIQSSYRYDFFEGMIEKMIKEHQNSSQTKEEIVNQLAAVREELQQSKKYYEQYLIQSKIEFEKVLRQKEQQLLQKTQILQFYESQRQKNAKEQLQFRKKTVFYQETIRAQKTNLAAKEEEFAFLQSKFDILKNQSNLKEKQIREQWQENIKTYEYKLVQKQQLIQEQQKQRKSQRTQFEYQITHMKQRMVEQQQKERIFILANKQLLESKDQLEQSLQKIQKQSSQQAINYSKQTNQKNRIIQEINRKREKQLQQIKKLNDQCEQTQKEKNLQAAFIKELQNKNKQLVNKLKTLESKKNEQKTAKKEMNAIKHTIIQQKKYCRQLQETIQHQKEESQKQKDQNQRLKAVIKEMKKQLEEVYHQFNSLKLIQSDRQKLLVEMEKSDRNREQLYRSFETMKIELTKTQQQNKALSLEVKHYRNALSRIQALKF